MPMFVQVKTPANLKRQIEGKAKESIFSQLGEPNFSNNEVGCSSLFEGTYWRLTPPLNPNLKLQTS